MCLNRLDGKVKPCKKGYKVMLRSGGDLYTPTMGVDKPIPQGLLVSEARWRYTDGAWNLPSGDGGYYPTGWHVFHTKAAARFWRGETLDACGGYCIVKVEASVPVATGWQGGHKVTVCKKIKITEVLND